jgi:hypothetical protein
MAEPAMPSEPLGRLLLLLAVLFSAILPPSTHHRLALSWRLSRKNGKKWMEKPKLVFTERRSFWQDWKPVALAGTSPDWVRRRATPPLAPKRHRPVTKR